LRTAHLIAHSAPVVGAEEEAAVLRVLRSGRLAQGPEVAAFEQECAAIAGRRYGVAVSSGTAAIHLALTSMNLPAGADVVIPAYACASLLTATALQGAVACICDVDEDFNLDPRVVPRDAKAAIVPHLLGKRATLPTHPVVIEDIAQSLGAPWGRDGVMAVASFYATKLITTGEGGMLLTDDEGLAEFARDRRDYDNRDDFVPRFSYKMTEMQAALGRAQLGRLPGFLAKRRVIAAEYLEAFRELPLGLPNPDEHVFFRFVITTNAQDALLGRLNEEGIEAKRPVYRPAHHYTRGGNLRGTAWCAGPCLEADRAHEAAVSLPIHPSMGRSEVDSVIEVVRRFFD
jgi:dTDP-4-amino-4,6-dideoxygalactose transaminase